MTEQVKPKGWRNNLLAIFLWVTPLLLIFAMVVFWPTQEAVKANTNNSPEPGVSGQTTPQTTPDTAPAPGPQWSGKTLIFNWQINFELRLLLLVLLAGALGSSIHAASSFSLYKGIGKLDLKWLSWYLMRTPVGAGLAVIITLLIQGGIFSPQDLDKTNPFSTLGLAALVGLFSTQALAKLREIFNTMFASSSKEREEIEKKEKNGSGQTNQQSSTTT